MSGPARRAVAVKLAGNAGAFRQRLERMGPTFVKLGQFLALRPDLVPEDYSRELMNLLDSAPPFEWERAKSIIEEDLGRPTRELFAHINPAPIATGSLAQTHVARLRDGSEVAVKVRRPEVHEQVRRDLKRADVIANLLDRSSLSLIISPRELVEEVGWWLEQELDFRRELRNLKRLRTLAAGSPLERLPRPYASLSSERVLTCEFLRGIPLSEVLASVNSGSEEELARVRRLQIDRETLASTLVAAVLRQIFKYRFFHADVHPGNLLVLPNGRIGFIDFGLCDELDESVREGQLEGLTAAYSGDVDEMFDAIVKVLQPGANTDVAAFRRDFAAHTKTWLSRVQASASIDPPRDGADIAMLGEPVERDDEEETGSPVGRWMLGTVQTAREHGMQIPPRVLSMYRVLLTVEAVAARLDARADVRTVGRNFFARLRIEEQLRSVGPNELQRTAASVLAVYRDGPRQLHRIMDDLADGRLNVNVTVTESAATASARARRTRLLAAAVASVAIATLLASRTFSGGSAPALALEFALVAVWLVVLLNYRRLA